MPITDPRRKIVADRLRRYFAELSKQLTTGAEDFWRRVESKLRSRQTAPPNDNGNKPR
jgi:hypothetical protein